MAVLPVEVDANVYLDPFSRFSSSHIYFALMFHGNHPIMIPIPQQMAHSGPLKVRFEMISAALDVKIPSE